MADQETSNAMDDLFGSDEEEETKGSGEEDKVSRDPSCGVLAFHSGTEEALFIFLEQTCRKGDVGGILRAVDDFCYNRHWMMHVGDQKLSVINSSLITAKGSFYAPSSSSLLPATRSFTAVELGSYCGYSAVVIGSQLDGSKGEHLFCVEFSEKCAQYTRRMVSLAELTDRVTIINASASDIATWKAQIPSPFIDFLFIDHVKNMYYDDLRAIVAANLLTHGSVVVADNVLCLNRPLTEYLSFVRDPSGPFLSSQLHEGFLEYTTEKERQSSTDLIDGVEVSIFR